MNTSMAVNGSIAITAKFTDVRSVAIVKSTKAFNGGAYDRTRSKKNS